MTKSSSATKLAELRSLMQQHNLDYYFIPAADPYLNEYVPTCWQRRSWISDFTGSAGDVLVGKTKAYLWTDGRYTLQAKQQLDLASFTLMQQQQAIAPPIAKWLTENAEKQRVGVDPQVINLSQTHQWQAALATVGGELVSVEQNLVDLIWKDRPALCKQPIELLADEYTGKPAKQKIASLQQKLALKKVGAQVINSLDSIAWLFNIRGKDIDFNPLVMASAIVSTTNATIYLKTKLLSAEQLEYFAAQNIAAKATAEFATDLQNLTESVLLDQNNVNWSIAQQLGKAKPRLERSPIIMMKALKNPTEINGAKLAHKHDGAAICRFLHWLENNWQGQTELSVSEKLAALRHENSRCKGLSFPTICGYGAHGAIIHYSATTDTNLEVKGDSLLLIDSGGQYPYGTTDITRTVHLGTPSSQQRHHYTLVLKGHLALRHLPFPAGTNGEHLNAIARQALWQESLDFSHGTGHGVGSYLCVHEGPQRISSALTGVALQENMIISNEPGLYLADQYGIRIENLCYIGRHADESSSLSGHGPFYQLQDLTLAPYARNLINKDELTKTEISWVNNYHNKVYEELKTTVPEDTLDWLKEATREL